MRIALQISGRLRYTDQSLASLMASLVEDHKPDVFCSFWKPENPQSLENLVGYLKPVAVEIEDQQAIRPYLDVIFPFNVHANMPSMSYKFHRVASLRRGYELLHGIGYDCVIQARADNVFFERLEDRVTLPVASSGIYCSNGSINPTIDPYVSPRMVDNFYLGDASSMDAAATTFWHLRRQAEEYTSQGMLHHVRIPEIIQSRVWNGLGIAIHSLPGSNPFGNFHYDIDRRETQWK